MKKVNHPKSSTSNKFSLRDGVVTAGLALMVLLSACGKKTEQKLNDHDIKFGQTEQVDSTQTVVLTEHTALIEDIIKRLGEQGIKIDNINTLDSVQTEKIAELYEKDAEFQKQMDKLNECCTTKTEKKESEKEQKKKPVTKKKETTQSDTTETVKKPTIEQENSPSDTTKTVKPGPKKDGEAFSF